VFPSIGRFNVVDSSLLSKTLPRGNATVQAAFIEFVASRADGDDAVALRAGYGAVRGAVEAAAPAGHVRTAAVEMLEALREAFGRGVPTAGGSLRTSTRPSRCKSRSDQSICTLYEHSP